MSEWASRRWWQSVTIQPCTHGFEILLDDRPVQTPNGTNLRVPTETLAARVAGEWSLVDGILNPDKLPTTRLSVTAVTLTDSQREIMIGSLLDYLDGDMICYRASGPPDLVHRQRLSWDPVLEHYHNVWGEECVVTIGVMPISQHEGLSRAMRARLNAMNAFELVATNEQVKLTTSLLLVMALRQGWIDSGKTWQLAQLDTSWQRGRWGDDEEDAVRLAGQEEQFLQASAFLTAGQQEDCGALPGS
ncbi:MAG: hypothetical protein OXC91_09280 [Rhodobacteraceae bacterium]|nr:hypothetical protein [Paracoccaceae bacterium]